MAHAWTNISSCFYFISEKNTKESKDRCIKQNTVTNKETVLVNNTCFISQYKKNSLKVHYTFHKEPFSRFFIILYLIVLVMLPLTLGNVSIFRAAICKKKYDIK